MAEVHKHLLLTADFSEAPTDLKKVEEWGELLVKAIDMELFIPPIAKYCYDKGNEGLSFFGMITTSHFSGHFFETENKLHFDLYSCKPYPVDLVVNMLEAEFDLTNIHYVVVDRPNDFAVIEQR